MSFPLGVFAGVSANPASKRLDSAFPWLPVYCPTCRDADRETRSNYAGSVLSRFWFGLIKARDTAQKKNDSVKPVLPTCRCTALSSLWGGRECGRVQVGTGDRGTHQTTRPGRALKGALETRNAVSPQGRRARGGASGARGRPRSADRAGQGGAS